MFLTFSFYHNGRITSHLICDIFDLILAFHDFVILSHFLNCNYSGSTETIEVKLNRWKDHSMNISFASKFGNSRLNLARFMALFGLSHFS